MKLHPNDLYAYGLNRGGIAERWFGSTIPADNENRAPDEGLSYGIFGDSRFALTHAVEECAADVVGEAIWEKYRRVRIQSLPGQTEQLRLHRCE